MTTAEIDSPVMTQHPLDPLTADEISSAVSIVRAQDRLTKRARFAVVALAEPTKAEVMNFCAGDSVDRRVELVILDKGATATYEVLVSVTRGELVSWDQAPADAQPPVIPEEWALASRFHRVLVVEGVA